MFPGNLFGRNKKLGLHLSQNSKAACAEASLCYDDDRFGRVGGTHWEAFQRAGPSMRRRKRGGSDGESVATKRQGVTGRARLTDVPWGESSVAGKREVISDVSLPESGRGSTVDVVTLVASESHAEFSLLGGHHLVGLDLVRGESHSPKGKLEVAASPFWAAHGSGKVSFPLDEAVRVNVLGRVVTQSPHLPPHEKQKPVVRGADLGHLCASGGWASASIELERRVSSGVFASLFLDGASSAAAEGSAAASTRGSCGVKVVLAGMLKLEFSRHRAENRMTAGLAGSP